MRRLAVLCMSLLAVALGADTARAADIAYSAPVTYSLSSPAATFTVAAGSAADSVVVREGSITVTIPLGSGFTLTSPQQLAVTGASGPGAFSYACSGGLSTLTVAASHAQAETLTIAPNGSPCGPSGGGDDDSGGSAARHRSGGGDEPAGTLPPSVGQAGSLQERLEALLAQLHALQAQRAGGVTGDVPPFARDLTVGSRGEDVRALQRYLNAHGFALASTGPGSPGAETDLFGLLTRGALARFQASVAIAPPAGYFGPITRAYVNSRLP